MSTEQEKARYDRIRRRIMASVWSEAHRDFSHRARQAERQGRHELAAAYIREAQRALIRMEGREP